MRESVRHVPGRARARIVRARASVFARLSPSVHRSMVRPLQLLPNLPKTSQTGRTHTSHPNEGSNPSRSRLVGCLRSFGFPHQRAAHHPVSRRMPIRAGFGSLHVRFARVPIGGSVNSNTTIHFTFSLPVFCCKRAIFPSPNPTRAKRTVDSIQKVPSFNHFRTPRRASQSAHAETDR